ncbi:alpha/beta hydrolase [Chitinophaga sedimenti]|uniref:alpha/beta hydrolase n=1 Tax=Chitinophaga sedimenti TaxID=2033606 RepID=UPI00200529F0|nr:alpha/beta hydrolase [Chitinophaga sedimenti]MCK7555812.1 alpha/beta hydrolase [Chitinophaga sedimenti]
MGLNAAAVDKRVKAVATTSMYDMSRVMAKGLNDSQTPEQRQAALQQMSEQRWKDAAAPGPRILPQTLEGNTNPVTAEFFDYYRTPRGFHKNSPNSTGSGQPPCPCLL